MWLFAWDDGIDMKDGEFHANTEEARKNFQSTLEFICYALLSDNDASQEFPGNLRGNNQCSAVTETLFGTFAAIFNQEATRGMFATRGTLETRLSQICRD